MRTPHTWLLTALALGCAWCTLPAHAQQTATWLNPITNNSETSAYSVTNGTLGAEWSVLNAPDQETQDTELSGYTLTQDGTLGSYLDFFAGNPLGSQESVYLALGISQNANGDQNPIEMDSTMGADGFRTDSIYVKARFERSATAPSMEDLQEMYATYAERQSATSGVEGLAVAAKVGIYVDLDGKFCLSRVRAGSVDETTGMVEDLVTEWCQTDDSYDAVGGGAVIVRIEFRTFAMSGAQMRTRAFRVYVRNADPNGEGAEEVCLTEGFGYQWSSSQEVGYQFDFSTLGQGEWFYAVDDAEAAKVDNQINTEKLDFLNQLVFSASGGGFYSAWMALEGSAVTNEAIEKYDFGRFSDYYAKGDNPLDGLVSDWASRYGVDMMDYATSKQAFRTMAVNGGTTENSEQGFNAFLLDMDPKLDVVQRLTVTGIVPKEDGSVTLTVRGPEGCNLRNAISRAGRICVTRAETLDKLSEAGKELIKTPDFNSDGSATLVLTSDKPMPFMKVTLEANIDVE